MQQEQEHEQEQDEDEDEEEEDEEEDEDEDEELRRIYTIIARWSVHWPLQPSLHPHPTPTVVVFGERISSLTRRWKSTASLSELVWVA